MKNAISEKIIELFTEPKNIDHKDEDIKKITKEYNTYISKKPKFTQELLKELILKDKENRINTTQEWFIDTLGFDYIEYQKEYELEQLDELMGFKIFGGEMCLTKFTNFFPICLMFFMANLSIEKKEWSVEKIRYITMTCNAMICKTDVSTISSFLIIINQHFYNKIHNIEQDGDNIYNIIYDAIFDTIKDMSPRLLDYNN